MQIIAWPDDFHLYESYPAYFFITGCCSKPLSSASGKMCEFAAEKVGKMCYAHVSTVSVKKGYYLLETR